MVVVTKEPCLLLDPQVEEDGVKAVLEALTAEETEQLTDATMALRHLRAEKGNTEQAIQKIKATLAWRIEFGVQELVNHQTNKEMHTLLRLENQTAKLYVRGVDKEGRAALYMHPSRENTNDADGNMKNLVYSLERAIAVTAKHAGKEKINLMIDYHGFRLRDAPPMSTTKLTLHILQNHYPERLHKAYILNPGFLFRSLLTMIRPFLDPTTREKIVLCGTRDVTKELVGARFDLNTVEMCAGGEEGSVKSFDVDEYLAMPLDCGFE